MECRHCHQSVDDIDYYCRWCGYPLQGIDFKKKFYGLWAMVGIALLWITYIVLFFVYQALFIRAWMVQLVFFIATLIFLGLSIVGIVHATKCKKFLNHLYGLATSIVACSLAGSLILCEMILIILSWI